MAARPISATKLLVASAGIATLLSCGGGGYGGSQPAGMPTASLALTAANAQNVAGDATLASLDASKRGISFALAQLQGDALPRTHVLSRFLAQQIGALIGHQQAQPAVLRGAAVAMACGISGTKSVDASGTTESVTFSACSDLPGESISGSFTISNIVATSTGLSGSASADLIFSFTGFPDEHLTGNFAFSVATVGSVTTTTLSGPAIQVSQGTDTQQLGSFTLVSSVDSSTGARTDTVTLNFASTGIGGSVNITTLTPFQTAAGKTFPSSGTILISGAMGSAIKLTVLGDESAPTPQVRIEIDADGNGIFETVLNKNWSDLSV